MSGVFFIVGRGRSGTTLLSRMLARHPALGVAPEGFFVMNLRRRYGRGGWDDRRVDEFCADLLLENRMKTWGLDVDAITGDLKSRQAGLTFAEACEVVYRNYAHVRGEDAVRLVGDKNPHYGLLVAQAIQLFPRARFLHIVRDYRDNILSYKTVPFDVSNTAALAYRWCRYNEEILRVSQQHPENFLRVRYEDLISEPRTVLQRAVDFLGVDFDDRMLSFHEGKEEGFYGEGSHWFKNLEKPLDSSQAQKWRSAMDPDEVRQADIICGPVAAQLGYEPEAGAGAVGLSPGSRAGVAFGWGSVLAEKLIFGAAPANLRIRFINRYRSSTGRI